MANTLFKKLFNFNAYASGGISTGTQFAQLHGTKKKPEFIFNYEQMGALNDLMSGGSSINIQSLVNVEGNVSDSNIDKIVGAAETGIEKLQRVIRDKGKLTRVGSSFV